MSKFSLLIGSTVHPTIAFTMRLNLEKYNLEILPFPIESEQIFLIHS